MTSHLHLVAKIAMGCSGYGLLVENLMSEGGPGMRQAVKRFDPDRDIRIVLIEGANRILPAPLELISDATLKLLDAIGVEVHTGVRVREVTQDGVRLANGEFCRLNSCFGLLALRHPPSCGTRMGSRPTGSIS